ncbi:MAG TPA: hypothetical protein VI876_09855 [Dehalococcoidia bacterium]|nr:hypothetical protein [Dehalococcoidia bacterium]
MAEASLPASKRLFPAIALPEIDAARAWLIFAAVFFFAIALVSVTDPDYWWHLRTGRLIVDNGAVPSTDPFSFTAEGKPWVAHEWLSEVIIYGTQSLGGYGLALLLFASVALATLLLAYRTSLWLGASRKAGLLLFIWAGVMMAPFWTVRPQVFTWFLFATFIAVCLQHRSGGKNRLWLLPPLMVLWANLHLGYAFGLAVIGVYAFSLAVERFVWKEPREIKPVLIILGACVAATLLTPSPVELLLYPLKYVTPGNSNIAWIKEWQSPDFHNLMFAPLALALLSLAGMGVFGRRRDLFLPLLALLFGALALQSVRNQPLFAIVFVLIASQRAADLWAWAAAAAQKPGPKPHSALNLALVTACCAALLFGVLSSPSVQLRSTPRLDRGIEYPQAGAHFLRDNYPGARVFNHYDWGGYLINELYPMKVFIDGRSDFYGDKLMTDFRDVQTLEPGWQDVVKEHDIEVFLIKDESALSDRLDAEPETWRRVFTGPVEAVFVRSDLATP